MKGKAVAQEYPQETAIIKVGEVDKYRVAEYAHFKDASGKAWNVGSELADYLPNPKATGVRVTFAEGNKLKVGFELHEGVEGRKPSRWVKRVRFANDDEALSPGYEPKPVWTPGSSKGSSKSSGEFRPPEQIRRGYVLSAICQLNEGSGKDIGTILAECYEADKWVVGDGQSPDFEAKVSEVADAFDADPDADLPF